MAGVERRLRLFAFTIRNTGVESGTGVPEVAPGNSSSDYSAPETVVKVAFVFVPTA
jgi:hypothetical protein